MSSHEEFSGPIEKGTAGEATEEDATLRELTELQDFLLRFREVPRVTPIPGTECNERENDVEHSYFLAMAGWYAADKLQLPLNHEKIFKYALVHDLPEAYTGDVDAFASPEEREAKRRREAEALLDIKADYGSIFPGMVDALHAYEKQEDPESQFIKALDKLMPAIMIAMDEGRSWQEKGVTRDRFIENKLRTTSGDAYVHRICHALVEFLKTKEYFPDDTDDTDDTPS